MTRLDRRLLAATVLAATAALALGIARTDLWPPDETRVAEISREMLIEGDWLVPRLNGRPFLEEPPLFYWLQAGAYRVAGGPSAAAARWPAVLAAAVCVAVTAALAQAVGANPWLAALVSATAPEIWWMARSATPDTAFAASTALAMLCFFQAWRSGRGWPLAAAAAAAGISFWLKGFLGVGLAGAAAVVFIAVAGRGRLEWPRLAAAAAGIALVAGLWLVALRSGAGSEGVAFFVLANHLGRLAGSAGLGHERSAFYYLVNLGLDLLPWSIALPASGLSAWRARRDPGRLFPLVWGGVMVIALSVSATKRAHYLLPAYPALAVLVAQWWTEGGERRLDRWTRRVLAALLLVVCPLVTLAIVGIDPVVVVEGQGAQGVAAGVRSMRLGVGPLAAAALVALLGVGFVASQRAGRPLRAAAAAGACALVMHALVVVVVLPAFNRVVSLRPWGEALGRAAECGVFVGAVPSSNQEWVSAFMFYAGRRLPEVRPSARLHDLLKDGPACILMRDDTYRMLPGSLRRHTTSSTGTGRRRFVVVSSSATVPDACPQPSCWP
jgi:4-amino-4-deoxy-L-arabinose transferase-like glycosyltransferase